MAGKTMNKVIITTTINEPTEALIKFSRMEGWDLIIVGDLKTPDDKFKETFKDQKNVTYLSPYQQEIINPELSDILGWNNIQRRNFGFWYAYNNPKKYEIFSSVDDDNIPNEYWGKDLTIGKEIEVDVISTGDLFFDPIYAYTNGEERTWHRGFPEQLLNKRKYKIEKTIKTTPLVQADFWSGDPDISAICRIGNSPIWDYQKYDKYYRGPFTTNELTPFNSQNTFFHRSVFHEYMMICNIGRYDDIWGAYILQKKINLRSKIVFNRITVQQDRNEHDLIKDLKNEVFGYENTEKLISEDFMKLLPENSKIKYVYFISEMNRIKESLGE